MRFGRKFLLASSWLILWPQSADAWWGKYGSKAEADIARREWVANGGQVKKTWTVKSSRRVRAKNPNSSKIPPMPKRWEPETYPWLITGEHWDKVEKDCWIENMSADQVFRYCSDVLNVNNRPRPKYPRWEYLGLLRERERLKEESKKPFYKTEYFDEDRFDMVSLRRCFHEKETRQYVCTQKRGLRKGDVYSPEEVRKASISYKYFKY